MPARTTSRIGVGETRRYCGDQWTRWWGAGTRQEGIKNSPPPMFLVDRSRHFIARQNSLSMYVRRCYEVWGRRGWSRSLGLEKEWGKVKPPSSHPRARPGRCVGKLQIPWAWREEGRRMLLACPPATGGHRGQVTSNVTWKDRRDASERRTWALDRPQSRGGCI